MPEPEHGHERDEREPDHERGGGGRRAARVANRVGLGQLARDSSPTARGPAHHAGQRLHQAGQKQGDGHEESEHPAGHQERRENPGHAAENGHGERQQGADEHSHPGLGRVRREPGARQHRPLSHRRDRRNASGPARGQDAGDQGDSGAEEDGHPHRARLDDRAGLGQLEPEHGEQRHQALGQPDSRARGPPGRPPGRSPGPRPSPPS